MSSLTDVEKRYLEKLLDMGSGYVLYPLYNDQTYGELYPDVQKFSHGLRDFRNYIHPYQ